jgi:hypothetical protein
MKVTNGFAAHGWPTALIFSTFLLGLAASTSYLSSSSFERLIVPTQIGNSQR